MNAFVALKDALLTTLAFEREGEPAGNVTVGHGGFEGAAIRVALVENRTASGAIGRVEGERLTAMFEGALAEKTPVVLFIDSAGAKLSEGLRALGAFRFLYRAGLATSLAGVPIAAVLGRNCYGGSSMLAHLAGHRLFSPGSQLAMSGPAVIASASGMNPLDEMFRAMAEATLSAPARAKVSQANSVWEEGADVAPWLRKALAPAGDPIAAHSARHDALSSRFDKPIAQGAWEVVRRKDLEKIYASCEARESDGIIEGTGIREGLEERFVGLVGKGALTATRAWRFSDLVWQLVGQPPERLEVYLDCATHAARLDEERTILSEFVADMGIGLASLGARGTRVGMTVAGKAGGGVYVALAAPAYRVASLYGAEIQVLPGSAVAAILGESRDTTPSFVEYLKAGTAELEIKLGYVP